MSFEKTLTLVFDVLVIFIIFIISIYVSILSYFKYLKKNNLKILSNINSNEEYNNITILIPTHNEENVISHRIENIFEIKYPMEKMSVIFIDDSSDATSDIILKYVNEHPNMHLITFNERKGYSEAIKDIGAFREPKLEMLYHTVPKLQALAAELYKTDPNAAMNILHHFYYNNAAAMHEEWKRLGDMLLAKYNANNPRDAVPEYPDWWKKLISNEHDSNK